MSWVKIDDVFTDSAAARSLSAAAGWAFVQSLAWSARHLTDGVIPAPVLRGFIQSRRPGTVIAELVHTGVIECADERHSDDTSCALFRHSYWRDFLRDSDTVKAERESSAARQRAFRAHGEHLRNGVTDDSCKACVTRPTTRPVPSRPDPKGIGEGTGRKQGSPSDVPALPAGRDSHASAALVDGGVKATAPATTAPSYQPYVFRLIKKGT